MMPMIATTMSSSMRVKPFWFFKSILLSPREWLGLADSNRSAMLEAA
jgi:hypothetical protein